MCQNSLLEDPSDLWLNLYRESNLVFLDLIFDQPFVNNRATIDQDRLVFLGPLLTICLWKSYMYKSDDSFYVIPCLN